ncbi:MAG: hypothetical protein Kow00129_02390 [Thermoleophilia bacterium]
MMRRIGGFMPKRALTDRSLPRWAMIGLGAVLFALTFALSPPAGVLIGPAPAAATTVTGGDTVVAFGDDVHIGPADRVASVVSFGGEVTIAGVVEHSVVSFGGDVRLRPGASVGTRVTEDDVSVVTLGGHLEKADGAGLSGKTIDAADLDSDWLTDLEWPRVGLIPLTPGPGFGWAAGLALWLVVGLIAVALVPRQLQAVQVRLEAKPVSYLGWGALEALVIFPLATLLVAITIVGLVVALPWALIIVPLLFVFGYLSAAGVIGAKILAKLGDGKEDLLLATVTGLVALRLVDLIPVLGSLALILVWLTGLGATVAAIWSWQRGRRVST